MMEVEILIQIPMAILIRMQMGTPIQTLMETQTLMGMVIRIPVPSAQMEYTVTPQPKSITNQVAHAAM